jgi:hypothetical protein
MAVQLVLTPNEKFCRNSRICGVDKNGNRSRGPQRLDRRGFPTPPFQGAGQECPAYRLMSHATRERLEKMIPCLIPAESLGHSI